VPGSGIQRKPTLRQWENFKTKRNMGYKMKDEMKYINKIK
jgi:hypothetical protein